MGYIILGIITFVLILYFIYDSVRIRNNKDEKKLSEDEIRKLYEGDVDKDVNTKDIRSVETLLSTEFAEEVLDKEILTLKDEVDEEKLKE